MSKVMLIAQREIQAYFRTWMGYIIIFAALLINGILFNAFAIGSEAKFSADVLKDFFFFSSGIGMVAAIFLAKHCQRQWRMNHQYVRTCTIHCLWLCLLCRRH